MGDRTQTDMLLGKGVFPYEQHDAGEQMNESALPARDACFSHKNNEPCTEPDYGRATDIWCAFNWTTLQEYLELLLKTEGAPLGRRRRGVP